LKVAEKNYLAIHIFLKNGVLCDFPALLRTANRQQTEQHQVHYPPCNIIRAEDRDYKIHVAKL